MNKNLLVLVSLGLLMIFQGCKTSEVDALVESKAIEEFWNLSSPGEKRLAFNVLTPQERYEVWSRSFSQLLKGSALNTKQKELVRNLSANFTSSLFEDEQVEARASFLVSFMPKWRKNAEGILSDSEIRVLSKFPTFGRSSSNWINGALDEPKSPNVLTSLGSARRSAGNCDCHAGNQYDCDYETTTTVYSCKGACERRSFGCGDWWLQSCDGVCKSTSVPSEGP